MKVGQKINKLRTSRGMTLEELGNKIGVSKSTIKKWEDGKIENMRRDKIQKLADVFDIPPTYFLDRYDEIVQLNDYTIALEPNGPIYGRVDGVPYYTEKTAEEYAQKLLENKDLRMLFDAAKDAKAEDIKTVYTMLLALQAKEKE